MTNRTFAGEPFQFVQPTAAQIHSVSVFLEIQQIEKKNMCEVHLFLLFYF
ncbi:MAG: hypothetical protein FWD60_10200 [Candidatus Azobacteroides sp.]|nr:hypothetical protein [Candidatus Azobacteroides sp.]